ncbi:MAG TPA: hypothetical protein VFI52_06830 [Gemmatimonadaceae bacterium]|nr:hypothetical protein [Gemmatimonadaceae bacterium]
MTDMLPLRLTLLVTASLLTAVPTHAQRTSRARCDRIATTSISLGRTGGNIRPSGMRIMANGVVRDIGDTSEPPRAVTRVPVAELRRIARRAWTGPFVRLPTAPTRPTPNPDAARDFIELRSKCGSKHVEYQGGTGAPEFQRLLARLDSLTRVR